MNDARAASTAAQPREASRQSMIVQVVLDAKLLQAADLEARRSRRNRSALIRDALREYLKRQQIKAWEDQEREAYMRQPQDPDEIIAWEKVAAWPED